MTTHPLPVGTRVYHDAQGWARSLPEGFRDLLAAEAERIGWSSYATA